ncbi:MAG: NAD(P)-binding domain-containing protein [Candidatus Bathyarchaeia archaeon]
MKICVVGLGEVGLPTARYMKESGFEVMGYDINATVIEKARETGLAATGSWSEASSAEIYVVCVSTGLRNFDPDMSQVYDVCNKIRKKERPTLISIESTVCSGTCRRIHSEIFDKRFPLVHVPHRYWPGDPLNHGVKQERVIGAVDEESLAIGLEFYKENLKIPLHVVSSIEAAETCKIAENAYRYVQIAFAEELRMICEESGLNFDEVREACNTKWNIEILEARNGIKGSCLPKDTKYLLSLTKFGKLLGGAIDADRVYQKWLSKKR